MKNYFWLDPKLAPFIQMPGQGAPQDPTGMSQFMKGIDVPQLAQHQDELLKKRQEEAAKLNAQTPKSGMQGSKLPDPGY